MGHRYFGRFKKKNKVFRVKKNEVFRVKKNEVFRVKQNELGYAGIGKIGLVRGWTDSEYEVGSARNSRINRHC